MPDEPIIERKREDDEEASIITEIAELLNLSVSELESKPEDIKRLLLHTYNSTSNLQEARKQLLSIVSPNYELQRDMRMDNIKNNPLKTVEELVEGNYNMIDGIINNEPPKKDQELTITREQIKANADMVAKNNNQNKDQPQKAIEK